MKLANLLGLLLTAIGCSADHSSTEPSSGGMPAMPASVIAKGGMPDRSSAMGGISAALAGEGGRVGTGDGTVGTTQVESAKSGSNSAAAQGGTVGTLNTATAGAGEGDKGSAAGMSMSGAGDAGMPAAAGSTTRPDRPLTYYESAPGFCAVFRGQRMLVLEWISNTWQFSADSYSCYATGNPVHMIGATSVIEQPVDGTWANGTAICKKCQQANGSLIQGITVED